jgi:glycosyltransferase involved in cell wall biosynthesis
VSSILVIAGHPRSLVNFRGPLLRAMQESGHWVTAAAPELDREQLAVAELEAMGVSCLDIPLSRTGVNPLADIRLLVALVRLVRSQRPDVVFAYTMKAVIFGLIAAAIAGVPRRYALITGLGYAFTGSATGKRLLIRTVSEALYRAALKRADKIFFQNADDAALFRQLDLLPRDLPVVVVNGSGIDLDHYAPASLPDGPTRFLLIARLLTAKGIREFAAAAAAVRKRHAEVEFHLVGGFDTNPDAIPPREVETWQRDGILVWHGEVPDVRPQIAQSHVYVLPSYREGTPRSVLEAMAMGRPIITTDAPGCRETVVEGENGILVAPREVEPLVRAMERFVAEPGLIEQMGKQSRILAETKYDVRRVNAIMLHEMELA